MIFPKWYFENDTLKTVYFEEKTKWYFLKPQYPFIEFRERNNNVQNRTFIWVRRAKWGRCSKTNCWNKKWRIVVRKTLKTTVLFCETTWMWCKKMIDFYFEKTEVYGKWSFWRVQNDTFWNRPKWYFLKNVTAENSLKWCLAKMILFKKRYR